ncbi:MAG: patatin-like phospholipase family protein [Hyphomicrobium sp.]
MSVPPHTLASVAAFRGLSGDDLARLEALLEQRSITRGEVLVREGDAADALYVVISGRFAVEIDGLDEPVAEISKGATIGEIAFFAGGARTASVRAIRDSVVVGLTRADFDEISARAPQVWRTITATLAERLAAETRRSHGFDPSRRPAPRAAPPARTVAVIAAGGGPIAPSFLDAFAAASASRPGLLFMSGEDAGRHLNGGRIADLDATAALNDLESRYETLIFIADPDLSPWSEKAVRQADEILIIADNSHGPIGSPVRLGEIEAFAASLPRPPRRRLAILQSRSHVAQGTRHWLAPRAPAAHHHVAIGDAESFARLWRFITGEALGFVACGGGAYCATHIGIYKAFREAGISFDMLGGASGGAAMAAAFAEDADPGDIDARVHRMFIEGKALARYTLPRYGLLDHTHFDRHLREVYGPGAIEDLWKPYFAVAADLTDASVAVLRDGAVWRAIRASSAIPGLLPPLYTDDGRTLVDGSVIANVPIAAMHELKRGPNIVVSFHAPEGQRYVVDYAALPNRADLMRRSLNPFAAAPLPSAPSAATVLVRSLMADRSHFERALTSGDWLMLPPVPAEMGALDWRRHTALVEAGYRYARDEIAKRHGPAL